MLSFANIFLSALFALFFCVDAEIVTDYTNCNSTFDIQEVRVEPCNSADGICPLQKGTNVTISIKFTPKRNVKEMSAAVEGLVRDNAIPFPLPNADVCVDSNVVCPMQAGQIYTYSQSLFVQPAFPKIGVYVKWMLKERRGKKLRKTADVCVIIKCKITD